VTSTFKLNPEGVLRLIRELHQRSALFKLTGGVHSAALGGAQDLAIFRQDIGRHNAVDKVIGHTILSDVATTDKVLVISGRISSDIILKAVLAGLPLVVSPSAPTHLAVETGTTPRYHSGWFCSGGPVLVCTAKFGDYNVTDC